MSPPSGAALRAHEKRLAGMLADPECVGDLLLVGLVFARALDFGDPPLENVVREAGRLVYGNAEHPPRLLRFRYEDHMPSANGIGWRRVRDVLCSDIRRYAPDRSRTHRCQRVVRLRRPPPPGMEQVTAPERKCGGAVVETRTFVDPVNGNRSVLGVCCRAICQRWWQHMIERNAAECAANPPPEPVANRGGILERHLDEIDWPKLYQHLDPKWKPPHEAPGWRPPKLQILLTNEPEVDVERVDRPALTVMKGGWR